MKSVFIEQIGGCLVRNNDYFFIKNNLSFNGITICKNVVCSDIIILIVCRATVNQNDIAKEAILRHQKSKKNIYVTGCFTDDLKNNFSDKAIFIDLINIDNIVKNIKSNDLYYDINDFQSMLKASSLYYLFEEINNDVCFIKICSGCNMSCEFCSSRFSIGKLNSKKPKVILNEYLYYLREGFKNFVFFGDDTGSYGVDIDFSFVDLLKILNNAESKNVNWYLDNLNPNWFVKYYDYLESLVRQAILKGIHISLQSGSNKVLKKMNRSANIDIAISQLQSLKDCNPDFKISSHFIIGHPGETHTDFLDTYNLLFNSTNLFDNLIVLPYSDNTDSSSFKQNRKVSKEIINYRLNMIEINCKDRKISNTIIKS
jgi:tRNA A37 methylthiotransferase MiaB